MTRRAVRAISACSTDTAIRRVLGLASGFPQIRISSRLAAGTIAFPGVAPLARRFVGQWVKVKPAHAEPARFAK